MPEPPRERAILVGLDVKGRSSRRPLATPEMSEATPEESMDELAVLTESAGAEIVDRTIQSRESAEAATLVGSGKVKSLPTKPKHFARTLSSSTAI